MNIDIETIKKISHLARLELKPEEEQQMSSDFAKILDWMDQLNELDTSNVEPLMHMHQGVNVFRKDIAKNELTKAEGLFNAPQKNEDYFMVPKVKE
ncbi:Asp-tRNA(Asn)/Glu-tRNA(Gln) amidotransferase subunit GatC [Lacihabitans sp. LS3-19]|uniref:Asp-tRNA(Asn)/Glu-tRNA(Gln) amidotransferase subunit GatC n=1 Tax=Lacihabitans sp. LS3-19 TaxID=2487335 RepID=UPI0020CF4D42|nr:Asp-tRNA(Asn)/Glu-tRNA(Gln) amidotransferase subunit GatC [Lacihabitans sp. LS3-19]MCP9770394.1 Asp-tRNA(Asn)/Glu-tRNA(Gln) amidotransferase subunit GatC [Lacihabitans sp. LS3-19]